MIGYFINIFKRETNEMAKRSGSVKKKQVDSRIRVRRFAKTPHAFITNRDREIFIYGEVFAVSRIVGIFAT